jgi:hypothetical protein
MGKLNTLLQAGKAFGMRDGMLRLQYEIRRSSGLMSRKMRSVEGWDSWDLSFVAPGIKAEAILSARLNGEMPFFFSNATVLGAKLLAIIGSDGASSAIADGERILAGHLPLFGSLSHDCGFPPRWFQNPVTGQSVSPDEPWTGMRFASSSYGDLKFILEPSRFLFTYALMRAYALTGDDKFPEAFWRAIEDWALHSPPMHGPLWICGQECSLRILAWTFALYGFIRSPSTTTERVSLLLSMIAAHAWRVAQSLGYARSQRSNHLITEAVGLWTAGTLYPELGDAKTWESLGARLLLEATTDQITPGGVSQQHSFNYQRMVLHLLLWTLRLGQIYQSPLHKSIGTRAEGALDFLSQWGDSESGLTPNYGADDGSLIFPLASTSYRDFRPLLQLGSAVLDRPGLPSGPWDETLCWFGVNPVHSRALERPSIPIPDETGYFRLGDKTSWAMIRAGRYTRRPFQADQLHVDLWWKGINLARDAGTYLYNGPPPWNNGFARTAIHNTVTVDNEDQMTRAGRFLWVDWAQASGRLIDSNGTSAPNRFEGEHDGYRRLGVMHRRSVRCLADYGWVIVDDLEGTGEHTLSLHWLTADFPFEISNSPFALTLTSRQSSITWSVFSSAPSASGIVREGKTVWSASEMSFASDQVSLLGWEAASYGELRPAISILCRTESALPVRFVTVMLTNERVQVKKTGSEISVVSGKGNWVGSFQGAENESELYRVSLTPGITEDVKRS